MRVQHPPLTLLTRYRTKFRGFLGEAYLDNVILANSRLREVRIARAEAPSSLWEDPEFSEMVRRTLLWNRATS